MSGYCETMLCPHCNEEIEVSIDTKQLLYSAFCHECGFVLDTTHSYVTLEQLNEERKEMGLDPLIEKKGI